MAFDVTRQEILKQANDLLRLYRQTRDQKYKDEENRLRRIVGELETITLGGGSSGVSQIVAGSNITLSPTGGTGVVTINASGGGITRTVDSYTASEGQTNFTITAATFDFVDVYVNGARLISSEYTIATNIVTITSPLELDDEVVIISYVEGGGGGGGSVLYTSTLVAYNTQDLLSGQTMTLSTDGTGTTGLIIPTATNATWNVMIDTIATVIGITGTATGVSLGDTYSETARLVFKKIGATSTLVAIVSSEAGFDTSMTTALMNYSVGGAQDLNLQFQFPTFAGGGLIEINAISKLEIVEVTYGAAS